MTGCWQEIFISLHWSISKGCLSILLASGWLAAPRAHDLYITQHHIFHVELCWWQVSKSRLHGMDLHSGKEGWVKKNSEWFSKSPRQHANKYS